MAFVIPSLTGVSHPWRSRSCRSERQRPTFTFRRFLADPFKGAHTYSIQVSGVFKNDSCVKLGVAMVGNVSYLLGNDNACIFV